MTQNQRILSLIGGLISLLWLAACSPAAPTSTPTLDLNPLRTQVAGTVFAQVTQDLASTPSITPVPSATATPLPSATPASTGSPTAGATAGTAVDLSSGTPTAVTVNQAQWVSQSIEDNTVFAPGQTFTMTWHLRNTGTSTWTAGYVLRFFSGNNFGASKQIAIGQAVPPGGEIDINIPMKAPAIPGTYLSDWVMSTENLSNFKQPVYLQIKVAAPVTATPTPKS